MYYRETGYVFYHKKGESIRRQAIDYNDLYKKETVGSTTLKSLHVLQIVIGEKASGEKREIKGGSAMPTRKGRRGLLRYHRHIASKR